MSEMSKTPEGATKVPSIMQELEDRTAQFQALLPSHIPAERFKRVLMTAISMNPPLARADRRSLWNSAMRAANDGLLPDGREGALVIYRTKVKVNGREDWVDAVQWMPMIAGIRKKVRNSGEIRDWNAHVVHQKDDFEFELGDNPFVRHKPYMGGDPGPIVAAYSVAHFKTGEISREVMMRHEIDKVRNSSRSKDRGPWVDWFEEMARKTVARRHSKVLPMSTDLDDLMRRDDALYDHDGASDRALSSAAPAKVNRLSDRLEALISPSEPDGPEIDGVVADDSSPQDTDERAPLRSSSDGRPSASGSAAGRGADSPHSSQGESAPKSSSSDKREKAAPKREAAQGAQAAETTKRDLYIADLKQEGERRAAQGMDALQEFLDGMEPDDQAYINPLVQGWYKTARAVDNGSAA